MISLLARLVKLWLARLRTFLPELASFGLGPFAPESPGTEARSESGYSSGVSSSSTTSCQIVGSNAGSVMMRDSQNNPFQKNEYIALRRCLRVDVAGYLFVTMVHSRDERIPSTSRERTLNIQGQAAPQVGS